jgi:hypothetical protein
MDLEQVDVVHLQTLQARIDRVENCLPTQATLIYVVYGLFHLWVTHVIDLGRLPHSSKALGQEDKLVAGDVVLLHGIANHLLRTAIGVDVCCVPRIQASVVGAFEELSTVLVCCARVRNAGTLPC